MTPRQADRLRQKIADIKRILAAEKRKFGWYDDSRGLRYLPARYYVQLGDFKGGLVYTRWFAKNFPDDAGFADFLFEWTIILFKNGKAEDAERKAIETFCADIHIIDSFLGKPSSPKEAWEHSAITADEFAVYFTSIRQVDLTDFTEWLATFTTIERFLSNSSQYITLHRQLEGERDLEKRRHLVRQLGQIARTN